jgi:hypothetical protein
MRFVDEKRDTEADEKVGTMHEKHVEDSVSEFRGVRVEGVDEQSGNPLVAHGGADINAKPVSRHKMNTKIY